MTWAGSDEEDGFGAGERGEVGGAGEGLGQGDAGQAAGLAAALGHGHGGGVAAPEADGAAFGGLGDGEGGAEGAGADHRDHALAPLRPVPSIGAAVASSGQRGRAERLRPSGSATAMRSAAAQAIIAPLSVQSASGGARKPAPACVGDAPRARRGSARWRRRRRRRREGGGGGAEGGERAAGLLGQGVGDGGLEAGAEVGAVGAGEAALRRGELVAGAADRGLEAGEGEVAAVAVEERAGEGEAAGVAGGGLGLDGGAAGLAEAEELRHLVEGLAGGVVDGAAEPAEALGAVDGEELAVAAGDQQHQVGEGDGVDRGAGSARGRRGG